MEIAFGEAPYVLVRYSRSGRAASLIVHGRPWSAGHPCSRSSFVAQAFDWVEAGGVDCGDHAAHDAYEAENNCGHQQAADVDVEVDVTGLEVVAEGAHQRKRAYDPGNYVGDGDAAQTSGEGDGESFG